jgi:cytochrome c
MPQKSLRLSVLALALLLSSAGALQAAGRGHAGPEEVVAKVREAARHLTETGEKGLARFKGKGSEYVWKDTYVFVSDCDKRTIVAHPIMPERDGKPIAQGPTYGGVTAAQRADAQCEAARKPGGGWFEYPFPKPGERQPSRKVTYMLAVPGTPYVVGAGVYDETVTLEQLQAVSGGQG